MTVASKHQGVASLIHEEWGNGVPVNIVLVTDGGLGHGSRSLQSLVTGGGELSMPFHFSGDWKLVRHVCFSRQCQCDWLSLPVEDACVLVVIVNVIGRVCQLKGLRAVLGSLCVVCVSSKKSEAESKAVRSAFDQLFAKSGLQGSFHQVSFLKKIYNCNNKVEK